MPAPDGRGRGTAAGGQRRRVRRLTAAATAIAALVALANVPTTTLQGVNYVVTPRVEPAYVKALDFVDRSVEYGRLAGEITAQADSDERKMRAVLAWTHANVRSTPPGFPVIDDHVWHIIVRGYGEDDQKADVFTTLLTYAGVRAYWIFIGPRRPELPLSLVNIGGRWRVVDVPDNVVFLTPAGGLATVDEVAADRSLLAQAPATYRGVPYATLFDRFAVPVHPDVTRAEMQMLAPRLWFELRRLVGRRGHAWEMRPPSRLVSAP
jgi:transglutaminase superfamily protein